MNKKLIAVALAALPVAAMADVTIYGQMAMGLENTHSTGANGNNLLDDYGSRIGFKGSETLGNGLKAIWQVETAVAIDGNTGAGAKSNTFANRQAFLGFEGAFGTVRVGQLNNALNDMGYGDLWNYNSNAGGLGILTRTGQRLKHAVRYDLPSTAVAGLSANVEYGFGENAASGVKSSDVASLGLRYDMNSFFGAYGYQKENNPGAQVDGNRQSASVHRLEGGYDNGTYQAILAYQKATGYGWKDGMSSAASASNKLKTTEYALTLGYNIGAFTPKFTYAKGNDVTVNGTTANNSGYRQYVLGTDYAMSKRTTAQFYYGNLKVKGGDVSGLNTNSGADQTTRTVSFNVIHKF